MAELLDLDSEFGARIARRLATDIAGWLTSVDQAGTPQPTPVWFWWDGATALIYSMPSAKRLARLRTNPNTALLLADTVGHDFAVLTGTLTEAPEAPPADQHPDYVAKYAESIERLFGTPTNFAARFTIPLHFTPTRARGA
ncbi:TIGR03667 family PPOX class F420-dependent oxidoreductase [Actinokineospora inagensis]|uniref:TIGR03667 family PPOX class F420-dependent oxidoreductase n=1 Tax=Actinokineospora inagensis TaxID=103730 RepID=UPI000410E571|nr:TIGR03667 family PPOX class F420-dependent oxidoreductase [Actinokineospora inagensis]